MHSQFSIQHISALGILALFLTFKFAPCFPFFHAPRSSILASRSHLSRLYPSQYQVKVGMSVWEHYQFSVKIAAFLSCEDLLL